MTRETLKAYLAAQGESLSPDIAARIDETIHDLDRVRRRLVLIGKHLDGELSNKQFRDAWSAL
jgi:hypothetical protein